jgi:hypothetical protein
MDVQNPILRQQDIERMQRVIGSVMQDIQEPQWTSV